VQRAKFHRKSVCSMSGALWVTVNMAALRLDQYRDELNAAQIAAGMNAAEDNAARLLADAVLLLNAGRYPTAASVAILCIEEAAQVSILRRIATCKDDTERQSIWNEYRLHRRKNHHSIIPCPFAEAAGHLNRLRRGFDALPAQTGTIDILKQLGFYTDWLGDANWRMPESLIEQQLAEQNCWHRTHFCRQRLPAHSERD
jgi:AbiV family abortive infection protein